MTPHRNQRLNVLVFQSEDWMVAQCLEHDIAAQAKTLKALTHAFQEVLAAHVSMDLEDGITPLSKIPPAPGKYHQMYSDALEVLSRNEQPLIVDGRRIDPVAIELRVV